MKTPSFCILSMAHNLISIILLLLLWRLGSSLKKVAITYQLRIQPCDHNITAGGTGKHHRMALLGVKTVGVPLF